MRKIKRNRSSDGTTPDLYKYPTMPHKVTTHFIRHILALALALALALLFSLVPVDIPHLGHVHIEI